jgi:hypothetical protein
MYDTKTAVNANGYHSARLDAGPYSACSVMATSLLMPTGYSTRKALYRSQCSQPGTASTCFSAKYE